MNMETLSNDYKRTFILVQAAVMYFYRTWALQEVLLPIDTPNIGNKDIWEEDFLFHVIDLTGYRLETRNLSFFSFHVRACADCALYLTDSEHVQNASELYSIYFGASRNNYSAIRLWRNKTGKQLTRTYGAFLDCNEFKSFWVSLNDGLLQFGKGQEAGTDVISTWLDPTPITINGVGIATGFGQTGRWKVPLSVVDQFIGFYSKCSRSNLYADIVVHHAYYSSKIKCASFCSKSDVCIGFNYQRVNKRCEILKVSEEIIIDIPLVNEVDWNYYTKCYEGRELCIGCLF